MGQSANGIALKEARKKSLPPESWKGLILAVITVHLAFRLTRFLMTAEQWDDTLKGRMSVRE